MTILSNKNGYINVFYIKLNTAKMTIKQKWTHESTLIVPMTIV